MPEQIVKQRSRGFICVNAHPGGCDHVVARQIESVARNRPAGVDGPGNALIIGSSTGYGLATRIAVAWGFGAKTVGVFLERPPDGQKTATAGYYNTAALHQRARQAGLYAAGVNADAFSDDAKNRTAELVRKNLGPLDLVVYSLAAPKRANPRTGEVSASALKPVGSAYHGKTIDLSKREVGEVSLEPASEQEIRETVAVMGGEDWQWWIEMLLEEGLLAEHARTLAYSYIGPEFTWPIYRDGTIGAAKRHLTQTARRLDATLRSRVGGNAWVSVNKGVVTQASAAIPVVPLYISLLFRVMKDKGIHEGCIEQMRRLCFDYLAEGKEPLTDSESLIRLDDLEMRPDVQQAVSELWPRVTTQNIDELSDLAGFTSDFNSLFGFGVEGVDYDAPVETDIAL
jgi:enoyl-[acyl-carrier protein] reductase/trans-2-enoyl-CoA reductase (NAD+)